MISCFYGKSRTTECVQSIPSAFNSSFVTTCWYHIYTIWLFTFSDLKTIIFPSTAFGIVNALAVFIEESSTNPEILALRYRHLLSAIPVVILWTWINLLPFAINNQRQPEAIQEDLLNKPWRSMPSGRLSPRSAKRLMLVTYFMAIITSKILGNMVYCLMLIALGFWYNNLRGADTSCVVRNLINAFGFVCFASGAMQAAVGKSRPVFQLLGWWYCIIACIVFTTVQIQDMYDQRGDKVRNRKTVPLVLGDALARWTIAAPMLIWCWLAPLLWESSVLGFIMPVMVGLIVAVRVLKKRTEAGDKRTFQLWNMWLVSVYVLPLVKAYGNLSHRT